MNTLRIIVAILSAISAILLLPLGVALAGEQEFKRISCRDASFESPYRLFFNYSAVTSVTVIVTRDGCRPTVRSDGLTFYFVRVGSGINRDDLQVYRERRAPLEAVRVEVEQFEPVRVGFTTNSVGARFSGTFDVKLIVE